MSPLTKGKDFQRMSELISFATIKDDQGLEEPEFIKMHKDEFEFFLENRPDLLR